MAGATIELRRYIEHFSQYDDFMSTREKIEKGRPELFDFPYPIFNEEFRKDFETNIIRKFYFREIGFETMGRFKFELENWLLINMPFYNKMFESELLEYDPLTNYKMKRDNSYENDKDRNDLRDRNDKGNFTQDGTGETNVKQDTNSSSTNDVDTNTTKNENTSKNSTRDGSQNDNGTSEQFQRLLKADTPDNRLGITTEDGKGVIEYASSIDETYNKGKTTNDMTSKDTVDEEGKLDGTGTNKTTEKGTGEDHTTGKSDSKTHNEGTTSATMDEKFGSKINEKQVFTEKIEGKNNNMTYAQMIQEDRESYLRIEAMIHEEMNKKLFMLIYL